MISFYKPNKSVKGTACSFYYNPNDKSFFCTMIKQHGWNEKTRTGSFSKNRNDPSKRVNVKLNAVEVASFIDTIESNREFTGYHGSNQIVRFKFCPYVREDKQVGFSLSVTKELKEDSTNKTNFLIGFTYPESVLLREHLSHLLKESFLNEEKEFKSKNKKYVPQDNGLTEQENNENSQLAPAASAVSNEPTGELQEDEEYIW